MLETGELATRLKQVAVDINAATGKFMEVMSVIEDGLKGMNLGITAEVSVNDKLTLGYGKEGNRWGLVITVYHEDTSSTTWSFKDAPREYRLLIVAKLPVLFSVLDYKAREMLVQLQESLEFLGQVTR